MASVKLPTTAELRKVGRQLGMTLSDADVAFFLETMAGSVAAYSMMEPMLDPAGGEVSAHARLSPGGRREQVQRLVLKSEIEGAPNGKLKGKRSRSRTTSASPACR